MALTGEEFEAVSNSCFTFELNKNIKRGVVWGEESNTEMSIKNQENDYICG